MLRSWKVTWRTCDNQLSDISPDNRHVLGTPAYGDGFGPTTLDVLTTRDGAAVRSFTAARNGRSATYFDEVWEDAEHVLVVTYQAGRWAVVRLGVDGSMEYAVAPRRGSMDTWRAVPAPDPVTRWAGTTLSRPQGYYRCTGRPRAVRLEACTDRSRDP